MAWRDLPTAKPPPAAVPFDPPPDAAAALCVLASGSAGNASVLVVKGPRGDGWSRGSGRRVCLIDAGVSPLRTRRLLAERGLRLVDLDDVLLTHLDRDHFHPGWAAARDCRATLRFHRRHVRRAERRAVQLSRNEPIGDAAGLGETVAVRALLCDHDDLGAAAFRFEFPAAGPGPASPGPATLGFATDLGRVTDALVDHLAGVDVLAIESNYCPDLQAASPRPAFLKRRITGGAGHLSNQQCLGAVERAAPGHAVFLHLSRECNRPDLVAAMHADAPYQRTIASQHEPTAWVWVRPSARDAQTPRTEPRGPAGATRQDQLGLFDAAAPAPASARGPRA